MMTEANHSDLSRRMAHIRSARLKSCAVRVYVTMPGSYP